MTAPEYPATTVGMTLNGNVVFATTKRWVFDDDTGSEDPPLQVRVRPLLVVDPDNKEQMRELASGYCGYRYPGRLLGSVCDDRDVDSMAAAVRQMLPKPVPVPVKPVEPTELGSVVTDVRGGTWVRYSNDHEEPWMAPDGSPAEWDDIEVAP